MLCAALASAGAHQAALQRAIQNFLHKERAESVVWQRGY